MEPSDETKSPKGKEKEEPALSVGSYSDEGDYDNEEECIYDIEGDLDEYGEYDEWADEEWYDDDDEEEPSYVDDAIENQLPEIPQICKDVFVKLDINSNTFVLSNPSDSKSTFSDVYNSLLQLRHNSCVTSLVNENEFLTEKRVEEMSFRDFRDEERNIDVELTFGDYSKKRLKGIPRKETMLIPKFPRKENFSPYSISSTAIDFIKDLSRKILELKEECKLKGVELKISKREKYILPNFLTLKRIKSLSNFKRNLSHDLNAHEEKVKALLTKSIKDIIKDKSFTRQKFKITTPDNIDLNSFNIHHKLTTKFKATFPFVPCPSRDPIDDRSDWIELIQGDKFLSAIAEACQDKTVKQIQGIVVNTTLHKKKAKIGYLKEKKTMKRSEVKERFSIDINTEPKNLLKYWESQRDQRDRGRPRSNYPTHYNNIHIQDDRDNINAMCKFLDTTELSDQLQFSSYIANSVLHMQRPSKPNEVYLDNCGRPDVLIIFGHGTCNVNKKQSRPFKLLTYSQSMAPNDLFQIENTYGVREGFVYESKWIRMPISKLEHLTTAYEVCMTSTIFPYYSCNEHFNTKHLLEEFCIKSTIYLNDRKSLQIDLDNAKYLQMGLVSHKCDVNGLISEKLTSPIQDEISLHLRRMMRSNCLEMSKVLFVKKIPKFVGIIRDPKTCGGEIKTKSLFWNRQISSLESLLDSCYLSRLTSKDSGTGYHDMYQALRNVVEWDALYDESILEDDSCDRLVQLIRQGKNKMQYHPTVLRICGKMTAKELRKTNCHDQLKELRADLPLSTIVNTKSMVHKRLESAIDNCEDMSYTFKKKTFEIRKKVHDVVVEAMSKGFLTLQDIMMDSHDYEPYFNMANKVQFGGPREIYIQDLTTRVVNYWVELNYQIIAKNLESEAISMSGIKKTSFLTEMVNNASYTEQLHISENRDASKWSLGATLTEFMHFHNGLSSIFEENNYYLILNSLERMKHKKLEIPYSIWKIWHRGYFDEEKLSGGMRTLYDRCKDSKVLNIQSNFMMGIFNYLSSVKHVSKGLLIKSILEELDVVTTFQHMEHSDDEFVCYTVVGSAEEKQYKIDIVDEVFEIVGMLLNIKTNYKKSNITPHISEFCSVFNFNGEYKEPKLNFLCSIFQPTSCDSWASDMEEYVGRMNEYVTKCGKIYEMPLILHFLNNILNRRWRFASKGIQEIFSLEQHRIPYTVGGTIKCDPILIYFLGCKAQILQCINDSEDKVQSILGMLYDEKFQSEELPCLKKMKFAHPFKKLELKHDFADIPELKNLPKSKKPSTELRRLLSMYKSKSFLKTYFKKDHYVNLMKIARFIHSDLVINDIEAKRSSNEFSYWSGKRKFMKVKTCTIIDYWKGLITGKMKPYSANKIVTPYEQACLETYRKMSIEESLVDDPWQTYPKSIIVQNDNYMTENDRAILGLRHFEEEEFNKHYADDPSINWSMMRIDMETIKPLIEASSCFDEFIAFDRLLSRQRIIFNCTQSSSGFLSAYIDVITCHLASQTLNVSSKPEFTITDAMGKTYNYSIFNQGSTEDADKLTTLLNLYTITKTVGAPFSKSLRTYKFLSETKLWPLTRIMNSGLTIRDLKNLSLLFINSFNRFDLAKEIFKSVHYTEYIQKTKDVVIHDTYVADNYCRYTKLMGEEEKIEVFVDNINTLAVTLYASEESLKGRSIKSSDYGKAMDHRSTFLVPYNKKYKIHFTGIYYTTEKGKNFSLKANLAKMKPKSFKTCVEHTISADTDTIEIGGYFAHKYNHKLNQTSTSFELEDFTHEGLNITELLGEKFITMYKQNRYVTINSKYRNSWMNVEEVGQVHVEKFSEELGSMRLDLYVARCLPKEVAKGNQDLIQPIYRGLFEDEEDEKKEEIVRRKRGIINLDYEFEINTPEVAFKVGEWKVTKDDMLSVCPSFAKVEETDRDNFFDLSGLDKEKFEEFMKKSYYHSLKKSFMTGQWNYKKVMLEITNLLKTMNRELSDEKKVFFCQMCELATYFSVPNVAMYSDMLKDPMQVEEAVAFLSPEGDTMETREKPRKRNKFKRSMF